jgi:hypothetical protein
VEQRRAEREALQAAAAHDAATIDELRRSVMAAREGAAHVLHRAQARDQEAEVRERERERDVLHTVRRQETRRRR